MLPFVPYGTCPRIAGRAVTIGLRPVARQHFLTVNPDTTARVGAWYPDNTFIRVDLPDPLSPEEGTSVGWIHLDRPSTSRTGIGALLLSVTDRRATTGPRSSTEP